MQDMQQIDAAERYLKKIEEKKASGNIVFLVSLLGMVFFIACSYVAFILKSVNE